MNKNQKGFTYVEVLLTLIFLAIIVFTGIYITKNHKTSGTSKQSSTNETAVVAGNRAASIATSLLIAGNNQGTSGLVSYVNDHVSDGDFTTNFKTAVDNRTALPNEDASPVACTNGIFPDSFGVGATSVSEDTAIVTLTLIKDGSNVADQYSQVPQVTLSYINNNWSIDNYICINNPNSDLNSGSLSP
jgi:hypothetical protein